MFEELSENSQQFLTRGRSTTRRQGVYEIKTNDGVQVEMAAMNTKIDMLVKAMSSLSSSKLQGMRSGTCTYNQGWKLHPNLSWRNGQNGQEVLKAITVLRSGKVVNKKVGVDDKERESEVVGASPTKAMASTKVSEKEKVILPPFPQRLVKQKKEQHLLDIFETLRKVEINIPLLDAIKQIPSYAKVLNDCCTHKRKFKEHEKVALTEEVSAVLLRKLPLKLKDPGSFTIPCTIGNYHFDKSLCDLDRSIKYPRGIIEDVLIRVDKLILLVDFLILDMDEDREVLIILGRPFLATARTLIDVEKGTLTMHVGDEANKFKVFGASQDLQETSKCYMIDYVYEDSFSLLIESSKRPSSNHWLANEGKSSSIVKDEGWWNKRFVNKNKFDVFPHFNDLPSST
ncbi:hypothetical protein ACFX12_018410 [Malus domestica]